tara:strand:+ start:3686 stop:3907 length:222 start_codon:yes stop_codon:yes gene_type:complete
LLNAEQTRLAGAVDETGALALTCLWFVLNSHGTVGAAPDEKEKKNGREGEFGPCINHGESVPQQRYMHEERSS